MRLRRAFFLFVAATALSGCATIFHGTDQSIRFESQPAGCTVTVDGYDVGTTPCDAKLKRNNPHNVVFKKPGYADRSVTIQQSFSGLTILDLCIVPCWLVAGAVDFVAGGAWNLTPELVTLSMSPGAGGPAPADATANPWTAPPTPLPGIGTPVPAATASATPPPPQDH